MKRFVNRAGLIASRLAPTMDLRNGHILSSKEDPLWERACSRRGHLLRHSICALLVMSLTACTIGPDFQKPQARQVTEWSKPSKAAASEVITADMDERWWEVFQDPKLSALTQRALACLLYTSPSPRDRQKSRMPSSA